VSNVYLFYVLFAGLGLEGAGLGLGTAGHPGLVLTTKLHMSPSTDVSNITLLPIIDMNPSDNTCMHCVLCFVESQAKLLNIDKACVTFDQPLWVEDVESVQSTSMKVFCHLGGFHMMSYIGSIGFVMVGSGLEEAVAVCYGSNTVNHMLSGKAISCAVREFFLVDGALREPYARCLCIGRSMGRGKGGDLFYCYNVTLS